MKNIWGLLRFEMDVDPGEYPFPHWVVFNYNGNVNNVDFDIVNTHAVKTLDNVIRSLTRIRDNMAEEVVSLMDFEEEEKKC